MNYYDGRYFIFYTISLPYGFVLCILNITVINQKTGHHIILVTYNISSFSFLCLVFMFLNNYVDVYECYEIFILYIV